MPEHIALPALCQQKIQRKIRIISFCLKPDGSIPLLAPE